jgi:glycosyltransferase involved in cell wall biosynthesis
MTDYFFFVASAFLWCLFHRRPRLLVLLTTPPLLPALGWALHVLRGQRYGIWSMDLHPEAEEAIGMVRPGSFVSRVLRGASRLGYTRAEFVVDLGTYMKARIRAMGVEEARLHTIPVWSDAEEIAPVPRDDNPLRRELGLEDHFVLMYSGNAGLAHRFEEILFAARALRDQPGIFFLFVGGGPRKAEILAFAEREALENLRYLDYFPRSALRASLGLADLHLMSLRSEMSGIAIPGKLYGIMAAGRPVLMVGPQGSESAETIEASGCGVVVDPDSAGEAAGQRVADEILRLYRDRGLAAALGQKGRDEFLRSYEARACCDQWDRLLARWV